MKKPLNETLLVITWKKTEPIINFAIASNYCCVLIHYDEYTSNNLCTQNVSIVLISYFIYTYVSHSRATKKKDNWSTIQPHRQFSTFWGIIFSSFVKAGGTLLVHLPYMKKNIDFYTEYKLHKPNFFLNCARLPGLER